MRRVSKKRATLIRIYLKRREAFLRNNPWCIRCGGEATEIQHARGRVGGDLLNEATWRAMCHGCHMYVTEHPREAYEQGWSMRRIGEAS